MEKPLGTDPIEPAAVTENEYRGTFTVAHGENIRYNILMNLKRILSSMGLLFGIIISILTYQNVTEQGFSVFQALLRALPMAVLAPLVVMSLQLSSTAMSIRLMYRQGKARAFTQDVTLNEEGFIATAGPGTSKVVWKNMQFVRETPFDFLIFYAAKKAFILPKKQMADKETEAAKIRGILRKHLPADRLKLKD